MTLNGFSVLLLSLYIVTEMTTLYLKNKKRKKRNVQESMYKNILCCQYKITGYVRYKVQ